MLKTMLKMNRNVDEMLPRGEDVLGEMCKMYLKKNDD